MINTSTETRAFILREMRDVDVVIDSLKRLKANYSRNGNQILVSNGVTLEITDAGVVAKFEEPHYGAVPEKNKFIKVIQDIYPVVMQEKIERLRKELAAAQEKEALKGITEERLKDSARRNERIASLESRPSEAVDEALIREYEEGGKQKRADELKRKRELARLEAIAKAEKDALRQKIEEEVQIIMNRAKTYGAAAELSCIGEKRVITLSNRR